MVKKNYYESRDKKMDRRESENTGSGSNVSTSTVAGPNKSRNKPYGSRQPKEIQSQRENGQRPRSIPQAKRESSQHTRENSPYTRENPQHPKENLQHRNYHSSGRHVERVKAEETVEDIKKDIMRIEKEIDLEIKEIRSLKL